MSTLPNLDDRCGAHFSYRDLVECGATCKKMGIANIPARLETYTWLGRLATEILDPVVNQFGQIELTYGFAGPELAKHIKRGIAPRLDQHASHELSEGGMPICDRGGAACDFYVSGVDSLSVSHWLVRNTKFDRLYYYGCERPIHVSAAADAKRQIVLVKKNETSQRVLPSVVSEEKFLKMTARNEDEQQ